MVLDIHSVPVINLCQNFWKNWIVVVPLWTEAWALTSHWNSQKLDEQKTRWTKTLSIIIIFAKLWYIYLWYHIFIWIMYKCLLWCLYINKSLQMYHYIFLLLLSSMEGINCPIEQRYTVFERVQTKGKSTMRENPQIHALEKVCCVKIRLNACCYCRWVNLAVINWFDTFYDVLFEILARSLEFYPDLFFFFFYIN